jgi:hypothetical protein
MTVKGNDISPRPSEKECMNPIETIETNSEMNILSLFSETHHESLDQEVPESEDDMISTIKDCDTSLAPKVVDTMFPDQSLFILEEQLKVLKTNLSRIKFYLGDINDLIPH